ncbi:uncharacterized protein LOC111012883 [Momordica charantia]|uniref:Uncharacterized protein LOC111012883 n=1 Tax=Momordica charantia TaxID=3673 RepID=A0A6J1CPD1_MOMCH|nr:uncharacterized protein LOC111012883 [Momordica charantia]
MQPQHSSRIDLGDLKAQIVKKLGNDKSKRYFFYLNRFLGQKLGKVEFDKLCVRVLGRENIQLHNQLIRSILKNACVAKTPPPINVSGHAQSVLQASNNSPCREDGPEQTGSAFPNQNQTVPIWSNGVLPASPRKGRSLLRDRKFRDRPSPLGPNGKVTCLSYPSTGTEDSGSKVITENGNVTLCDYQRPVQHLQAVAELPENDIEGAVQRPSEKPRIHPTEAAILEDGEEVEQSDPLSFLRGPLLPPLGIPFCSASVGGARRALPIGNSGDFSSCYDSIGLSDTETVRKRMEQIATAQGLEGVSMECSNILNSTLDLYLKQLIKSCLELVRSRSTLEHTGHPIQKQQNQGKVINGMWPSNHLRVQNSSNGRPEVLQEKSLDCSVSLLDFKVAMELNPKQLGEDWPLLLEKICMRTFEE